MGTELYILLSILGLFVFSCICFTCCCNCFGERRRRRENNTSSDTCLYCYGCPDYGPGCWSPYPTTHSTVNTADCEATDAAASNDNQGSCFGCCTGDDGCCGDQEGCCDGNGNNDSGGCCDGGEGGGCCDGADGGDSGGCCDGDTGGGDASGCCDGGGGDAGGCDGGGGDCDCSGC